MKQLADWLDASPGMATRITKELGINPTNISNWRNGRKLIPWRHMAKLAKLSRGRVTLKAMMDYRQSKTMQSA